MGRNDGCGRASGWAAALFLVAGLLLVADGPVAAEGPALAGAGSSITDLLPKAKGEAACFTATLANPVPLTVEDWSDGAVTFEEVPGLLEPSGKPATRPVPKRAAGQVSALVLSLAPDDLNESEPYRFLLSVSVQGRKRAFRASGPCNLFDPVETGLRQGARGATKALGCAVECDGGSVAVERQGAGRALSVTFDESGLRMTPGCSDEEEGFRVKAPSGQTLFTLAPADEKACRALRAWDRAR